MYYPDEINKMWSMVLESLKDSFSTSTAFEFWLGDLKVQNFHENRIIFVTESEFKFSKLKDKYMPMIEERFGSLLDCEVKAELVLRKAGVTLTGEGEDTASETKKEETESFKKPDTSTANSNFDYTFDTFIEGNSNRFAVAACKGVVANPGSDYNPLFIYGPSGIGKTHLMHAVTNEIKKRTPEAKIVYISGEQLINELVDCIAKKEMVEFREKYRSCDVLLIDDIQFIAGKIAMQEEFFHTFNALYDDGKQILLTSDRPPKDITPLEERIRSRFEWGLIADVQEPDLELRIAIIKKKAEIAGITIPDDILTYLAENLRSNIRQIEGIIKKIRAHTLIVGEPITMELARQYITELFGGEEPVNVTIEKIFSAVYRKYNISKEDIISLKRQKEITFARHVTIYLLKSITDMSLPSIGKIVNRNHSTALSSVYIIEKKIRSDRMFELEIKNLEEEVKG